MTRLFLSMALVLMAGAPAVPLSAQPAAQALPEADLSAAEIQAAVDQVKPALVRIKVVEPAYYDGRANKAVGFGSGTIISPDGYVVTNHHVAGKAVQLEVTMADREEIPAILIGTDPATDIAVIKLQPDEDRTFPLARWGNSDTVRVGDPVLALGSPLSISQSVTLGILANTEMITPPSFRGSDFTLDGVSVGDLVRWFGHDAAIYPGNSGGPLINLKGEIIGVNEIGMGLGGAIPGNLARNVAEELIERGYVRRAFFGIGLQPLLQSQGTREGVLISGIVEGAPAEAAGLQAGDVLLAVGGEKIEGRFAEQLPTINQLLAVQPIGEEVELAILRNGQEQTITIVPEEKEPLILGSEEFNSWGMTARTLTRTMARDMALDAQQGVLVTSTRSGGPAAKSKPELRAYDVITRVGDRGIASTDDLESQTAELREKINDDEFIPVVVEFEREGEVLLTVVEVGIDELDDPAREVRKAWLPIETQVLTRELAKALGMPDATGVRVTRVFPAAGDDFPIQRGDILLEFDEMPIDASRPVDQEVFETMVRQYKVGMEVPIVLVRDGDEVKVSTTLRESPETVREMRRYRDLDFEFTVREATYRDQAKPELQGASFDVLVDGLTTGGWADLAGLMVGDAVLKIDGAEINGVEDVEAQIGAAREARAKHVVFFVRRGTMTTFVEIEPTWEE